MTIFGHLLFLKLFWNESLHSVNLNSKQRPISSPLQQQILKVLEKILQVNLFVDN